VENVKMVFENPCYVGTRVSPQTACPDNIECYFQTSSFNTEFFSPPISFFTSSSVLNNLNVFISFSLENIFQTVYGRFNFGPKYDAVLNLFTQ
jgi:hypothetical protein